MTPPSASDLCCDNALLTGGRPIVMTGTTAGPAAEVRARTAAPPPWRLWYLRALTWAFMLLTAARLMAYLPTALAIVQIGDSRQHSLWTWLIWVGANTTMAAWLYETNGCRMDKAIGVSIANAVACALMAALIVWYRF